MELQTSSKPIELVNGAIQFVFRDADGNILFEGTVDSWILRLTCEYLEEKHKLPETDDGQIHATPEFLRDLAAELQIDVPGCTPTMALKLWQVSHEAISTLKKNLSSEQN
jgi:hypothetical protein